MSFFEHTPVPVNEGLQEAIAQARAEGYERGYHVAYSRAVSRAERGLPITLDSGDQPDVYADALQMVGLRSRILGSDPANLPPGGPLTIAKLDEFLERLPAPCPAGWYHVNKPCPHRAEDAAD